MNRRAAITALVAAVPGLAMSADKPIQWTTTMPKPRITARYTHDGWIEIPLDDWCGWRVQLGGESIEISAAELFEALSPGGGGE